MSALMALRQNIRSDRRHGRRVGSGFVEIPECTKTSEHTCFYRNALLILFLPLLLCGFMILLLFVCHLYAIKFKWILIQRKLNSDMFGISAFRF